MRPRSRTWRTTSLGVAGLLGAAALVAGLGAAPAAAAPAKPASADAASAGQHVYQTPQQASAQAIRTGEKVAVTGSTTPTSTLTANPDGTFTLTESTAPVRAKVGGTWRNLDASLVRNSDGTWSPAVSSQPLTLSGGGTGPLATTTYGTYSLALTAPMRLPAPVIAGDTATYDSVLPGVDLIVTAQPSGGFSEVLRIASAAAAANPALQALTFTTKTKGVTLKTAGNGSITAVDRAGQVIFAAPAPQMWDSASTTAGTGPTVGAAESTAAGPGAGAHIGRLGVSLAGGRITLTPDRQLLTGPGAVYPEYLDPNWDAAGSAASSWAYVSQQFPTTSYYDTDLTLQVGQDPDATSYTSYSFYTLPIPSQVYGAVINTAYAYFPEVWAYSCTASPVQAWLTGAISSKTTWDSQPAWDSELGSDDVAYGWSPSGEAGGPPPSGDPGCGDNDVAYTITSTVATAAADGWPGVTIGLKASDTTDPTGWKQFADPDSSPSGNATLSITYADTPATPVLSTSPAANCATGTSVLGNGNVSLNATVSDVNGTATGSYTVTYTAYADGNTADTFATNPSMSVPATAGNTAALQLKAADLENAVSKDGSNDQVPITWTASVSDGVSNSTTGVTVPSSPTASCTFIFSTAVPGAPQIFDSAGNPGCDTLTYTAGTAASFTLEPNGTSTAATEPTSYTYQLNGGNPVTVNASTSSPYSAAITVTPTGFTNTLIVEATGPGGNIGQASSCNIGASRPTTAAADQDLTGDGIPDLLTVGNGTTGTASGGGLWLATGQAGSKGFDGTVTLPATDIAPLGPQPTASPGNPASWNGLKVITGEFTDSGFNDVEAYDPGTPNVYVLPGNGNGTVDTGVGPPQLTDVFDDTNFTGSGIAIYPLQLVNAYHVSCAGQSSCEDYPDQIGLFSDTEAGAYLAYFENSNGDNSFDAGNYNGLPFELTNTSPDGTMDWTDWTITTANTTPAAASGTEMWLWNKTTGALYLWQLTGLTGETTGGFNTTTFTNTNPTATLSCTASGTACGPGAQTEISADWNQGATLDTFQATEIDGEPGLVTVSGTGQVQSWYWNGTTMTQAGSTQDLLTADHTWLLDEGTSGSVGTAAATDQPGATDTAQDLTGNTGTNWNTGGPMFSPDVAFNGSNGGHLISSAAVFNPDSSYSISAWVNPSALGGTVFSLNGTDDSSVEVSSTTNDHWSIGANTGGTTTDSYASVPGGTVQLGMWINLTLTYDTVGNLDLLDLYVNGVEIASLYATPPAVTGPFVLGASQSAGGYGSYLTGQLADVQIWDSLTIAPTATGVTGAPAAFDSLTGNQDLYASGTSGTEYQDTLSPSTGLWSGWQNMNGVLTGGTAAIYNPDTGSEQVFGVGTTDSVYVDSWANASSGWSGWQALATGSFTGTPAVLYDPASGNVEVYATSTSGTPEEDYWIRTEEKWSGWQSLGGDLTGSPAAVYNPSIGGVQVFGIGTTADMYVDTWTPASGWSSWQVMTTGTFTGTPAALYDPASGNVEVYARSTSTKNAPEEDSWISSEGKWSGWNNLGGGLSTSPAAIYNPNTNNLEVFGAGTGSTPTVYEDTWTPGTGWSNWVSIGGALTSTPAAVFNPNADTVEIFGIGTTGEVYENTSTSGSSWSGWTSLGSTTLSNL